MTRASLALRNAAQAANAAKASASKAEPMSADHTLYHVASTGFWKRFRDAVVINPEISTGLPIPTLNRYPPPGSRPERYATPATQASDPAFNPYWKRDARRSYPQTSYITQKQLSNLLIASETLASISAPETKIETPRNSSAVAPTTETPEEAGKIVAKSDALSLESVIAKLPQGKAFTGSGIQTGSGTNALPPTPPKLGPKWVPVPGDEIPAAPYAYFPMVGWR